MSRERTIRKTKVDGVAREYLKLSDRDVDNLKYWFIDEPITSMKVWGDIWMGQGCAWLNVVYYNGNKKLIEVCQKEHISSLAFYVWEGEDHCADPRVIATHILATRIMKLGKCGGLKYDELNRDVSDALSKKIPTIEEAENWLEKNYFIGPNSLYRRAIASGDLKRPYDKRKYPECWLEDNFPGWNIWELGRELEYVPKNVKPLYDKYYDLWKKSEDYELWHKK